MRLNAVSARDRADEAGLQERAPLVHQTAVATVVVLRTHTHSGLMFRSRADTNSGRARTSQITGHRHKTHNHRWLNGDKQLKIIIKIEDTDE